MTESIREQIEKLRNWPKTVAGEHPIMAANEAADTMERLREALETIRTHYGSVCDEYGTCQHKACTSSYGAWALADEALADRGREAISAADALDTEQDAGPDRIPYRPPTADRQESECERLGYHVCGPRQSEKGGP